MIAMTVLRSSLFLYEKTLTTSNMVVAQIDDLLSKRSGLGKVVKLIMAMVIFYAYADELQDDCKMMIKNMRERTMWMLMSTMWLLTYSLLFIGPVRSAHISTLFYFLKNDLYFFSEVLVVDAFLNIFLFFYLLYKKLSYGKKIDNVIARRNFGVMTYMLFLLVGLSVLMASTYYHRHYDSKVAFTVYYCAFFSLFIIFDTFESITYTYFLFMLGNGMAMIFYNIIVP